MKFRSISTLIFFAFIIESTFSQTFTHEKLGGGFSDVSNGVISSSGYVAFSAALTQNFNWDVYLGSANFSGSVLGVGNRGVNILIPIDLTTFGGTLRMLWLGSGPSNNYQNDAFDQLSNLSPLLGSLRTSDALGYTPAGIAIWSGNGSSTAPHQDLYIGATNYSISLLGSGTTSNGTVGRAALGRAISPINGNILWEGSGSATGYAVDVFINTTNVSRPTLGSNTFNRSASAIAVNDLGTTLWQGYSSSNSYLNDVFKTLSSGTTTNLSSTALGSTGRSGYGVALNSGGTALWDGSINGVRDVYKDTTNISASVVTGTDRENYGIALNDGGHVLWQGSSAVTTNSFFDLFVDGVNITRPILGSGERDTEGFNLTNTSVPIWRGVIAPSSGGQDNIYYGSTNLTTNAYGASRESDYLASNSTGQVLWTAQDSDGSLSVWLSTPTQTVNISVTAALDSYAGPLSNLPLTLKLLAPLTGNVMSTVTLSYNNSTNRYEGITSAAGLYDVRFSAPHFLTEKQVNIPIIGSVNLHTMLFAGDSNNDNVVDDTDLLDVINNFLSTTAAEADFNGDGIVDDSDLLLVINHFLYQGS